MRLLMRNVVLLFAYAGSLVVNLSAAPPRCKTVQQDGTTFELCEREDSTCETLAKEQVKNPSKEWHGCVLSVRIFNSHFTDSVLGVVFYTGISVTPSYVDSERMDVTVTFDKPHCGLLTHVRKDVPIIIHDDIPLAPASKLLVPISPTAYPLWKRRKEAARRKRRTAISS